VESIGTITFWVYAWVATIGAVLFVRWRKKVSGSGLVFAYLFNFSLLHWFGGLVYIFPWYRYEWNASWFPGFSVMWMQNGFQMSAYGVIAFAAGSVILAPFFARSFLEKYQNRQIQYIPDLRLMKAYIFFGFFCYFVLGKIARAASLDAVWGAGINLMIVGLGLSVWKAWQEPRHRGFRRGLLFSLFILPFLSVVGKGFMSYGATAMLCLIGLIASFYKPRWKIVVLGVALVYLGLSIYVMYMRDRAELRKTLWNVESTWSEKIRVVNNIFTNFEWFDIRSQEHLMRVDSRLNQNILVGASVTFLSNGNREFAKGETIRQAFIAFIPRALWPNKPVFGGSGSMVSDYTGIPFAEGTSVGVGQVLEFYMNFGLFGIIGGFLILGTVIGIFDLVAREHLLKNDWHGFASWFLPGLALMQVGWSLSELAASLAGSVVMIAVANLYLKKFRGRRQRIQ